MIHQRIKAMAKSLEEEGRDDFRVEKDRCAMTAFFARNNLPMCGVLGTWNDVDSFKEAVNSGAVAALAEGQPTGEQWPMFIKACHLTQSSSSGTMFLKSKADAEEKAASGALDEWIDAKWAYRADDFDRPWRREGNMITDSLTPRFLVQAPFVQPKATNAFEAKGRYAVGLLEMRVEVLWGRAYLAILDGNAVFTRDGHIEHYTKPWGFLKMPASQEDVHPKLKRLRDTGYLDCAWSLAERAARATAIDAVRIDIFLKQGEPDGCTLNENSLSSGTPYWGHEEFLATTWAAPHRSKVYQLLDTEKP